MRWLVILCIASAFCDVLEVIQKASPPYHQAVSIQNTTFVDGINLRLRRCNKTDPTQRWFFRAGRIQNSDQFPLPICLAIVGGNDREARALFCSQSSSSFTYDEKTLVIAADHTVPTCLVCERDYVISVGCKALLHRESSTWWVDNSTRTIVSKNNSALCWSSKQSTLAPTQGEVFRDVDMVKKEVSHFVEALDKGVLDESGVDVDELRDQVAKLEKSVNGNLTDLKKNEKQILKNLTLKEDLLKELEKEVDKTAEEMKMKETEIQGLKHMQAVRDAGADSKVDYESGKIITSNGTVLDSIQEDARIVVKDGEEEEDESLPVDPAVMQEDLRFLKDLTILLCAATMGGALVTVLRVPVFVGFVFGGMIAGPSMLDYVVKLRSIETLAMLGGPLLLFDQGMSLQSAGVRAVLSAGVSGRKETANQSGHNRLQLAVHRVASFCQALRREVALQVSQRRFRRSLLLVYLYVMCSVVGLTVVFTRNQYAPSTQSAVLLAGCVSVSSTAVGRKTAEGQGHQNRPYFKVLMTLLLLHDLGVAVLVTLPSALLNGALGVLVVLREVLSLLLLLAVFIWIASEIMPIFISCLVPDSGSAHELFILSLMSLCMGAAIFTRFLGLSTEMGSFFSGLVLSQTRFAGAALKTLAPVRDIFSSLYFASIGMLLNPVFIYKNISVILTLFAVVYVFKFLIALAFLAWHHPLKQAVMASMVLAQISEFAIMVLCLSYRRGLLPRPLYLMFLTLTVVSLILTPLIHRFVCWATDTVADTDNDRPIIDIAVARPPREPVRRQSDIEQGVHMRNL